MGNPLKELYIFEPATLINVFYFEKPVTLELTAKLFRDGTDISSKHIKVEGSSTAEFDFYSGGGDNAAAVKTGKYHVELYFDGEKISESDVLTVK